MTSGAEVLVVGDLNMDIQLEITHYPAPGGEGIATRQRIGFGGSGANTAVVLAALGFSTSLIGCVGRDDLGKQAIASLAVCGVGTASISFSSTEGTSLNLVTVTPDGERTMFAYRGASAKLSEPDIPEDLSGVRHLHISGYALFANPQRSAALAALEKAKLAGARVSLDVPVALVDTEPDILRAFLPQVDLVSLGDWQAKTLMGVADAKTAAEQIAKLGVSYVAVTRGEAGVVLCARGELVSSPARRVKVLDTTGAGDSFSAGFIAALLRGVTSPTQQAVFANACGAGAVSVLGAGAALAEAIGKLRKAAIFG